MSMRAPPRLTHAILTRFSVRAHPDSPLPADWLEYRLALFEAYCLPSLEAQTAQDFTWLVFCDESTDRRCLDRLRALERRMAQLRVELTAPGRSTHLDVVARARAAEAPLLLSTRVDSDDALSVDMVERIQSYAPAAMDSGHPSFLLNFPHGYKLRESDATFHETWNPHSPHLTLFERLDGAHEPLTVQAGNHGFMQERHPLHLDAGPPAWLQVVHGGNVSNTMISTDRPVARATVLDRFAIAPRATPGDAVAAPQPADERARPAFRQALEDALMGGARGPGAA